LNFFCPTPNHQQPPPIPRFSVKITSKPSREFAEEPHAKCTLRCYIFIWSGKRGNWTGLGPIRPIDMSIPVVPRLQAGHHHQAKQRPHLRDLVPVTRRAIPGKRKTGARDSVIRAAPDVERILRHFVVVVVGNGNVRNARTSGRRKCRNDAPEIQEFRASGGTHVNVRLRNAEVSLVGLTR
jgi:hypothetical protein